MKRYLFLNVQRVILFLFAVTIYTNANSQSSSQTRKILDRTAQVVGRADGASANFTISSAKMGKTSGTIAIKGNKFHARTPQAMVWFDGKTQWSYMKSTNEVNISTPSRSQQISMNPYTFINMYKAGYRLSHRVRGNNYEVHMVAQNKNNGIPEMYIYINKRTYSPSQVKIKQGGSWTVINISNFKAKNLPNSTFVFRSKDLPSAEVIDLR